MSISSTEFEYIKNLVRQRSAIVLDSGKEYLVESRLEPIAKKEGFRGLSTFVSSLQGRNYGKIHYEVIEAMTTNETSFFRDSHPFQALQKDILPKLLERRKIERRLNIWSGASSSGQEPYTIAMVLNEFRAILDSWSVFFLATDISQMMLERSKQGIYSNLEVSRGLPEEYLRRHFNKVGSDFQVRDELRRMIQFREMNLADPWPALPQMDIVFLRNVMIYFEPETKKTILGNIRRILRPDGYLFLGGAETTNYLDDHFERVQSDKAVVYHIRP